MAKEFKEIAIYIRVSTEDQAKEGYSLEVQRECLEFFAEREGYEIYQVYSDDGISGYSLERPALKKLLEDAKHRKFDLVLVYKIDRFSRNLRDLLNLMDKLSFYEVGFNANELASGIYIYILNAEGIKLYKKMMLVK